MTTQPIGPSSHASRKLGATGPTVFTRYDPGQMPMLESERSGTGRAHP
jgi:hypothetical protein